MRALIGLIVGAVVLVGGNTSYAQSASGYPNKPVRLLVPFAPGGPADLIARIIGQKFSEAFGKQFYVETPSRRRRQHRYRRSGARAGRRLLPAGQQPGAGHQREPVQVAALRSGERSRRHYADRDHAQRLDRQSVRAGQDRQGAGRPDAG